MDHVKTRPDAPAGFFEAEAAGLRWLAAAGGVRVATVRDVSRGRIVLEHVAPAPATREAAHAFGRDLARTHAGGAPAWGAAPEGWDGPLFIGSREMPRATAPTWGELYGTARVLPFLAPALASGFLTPREADTVRAACDRIVAGDFDDDAPPARLHGDLWAGNVLFSPDGVVLIDPAAHGGHPETDLAMLALFGLPFLDDALAGYVSVAPPRPGWRARVPLHQLHPLAVHAAGHGRGYGVALAEAAAAVLALGR